MKTLYQAIASLVCARQNCIKANNQEWLGRHTARIVTPDLAFGYSLRITGPDRNGIKEYLHEVFGSDLQKTVEQPIAA